MWDWAHPPFPIQRVEVPNDGFMRGQPTNCYIVGQDRVIVIDPGSQPGIELIPEILAERGSPAVEAIFLTHAHPDHAIAVPELRRTLNAPVMLHSDNDPIMNEHISWDDIDVHVDPADSLVVEDIELDLYMTPGHAPGHIALFEPQTATLIAGDLVSGNGTIGVFPPSGSMVEYIDSLKRVQQLAPNVILPGHGPEIHDARALFEHYLERRLGREQQILELVADGGKRISDILPILYPELLPEYSFPAEATILAHLLKLEHDGKVRSIGPDQKTARWVV